MAFVYAKDSFSLALGIFPLEHARTLVAMARRTLFGYRDENSRLPADLPIRRLHTAADVVELVGETINQVRRGEIDLRVSNAIGYLSGILLNAIEKGSFEERLAALEDAVNDRSCTTKMPFDEEISFDFVQQDPGEPNCPH